MTFLRDLAAGAGRGPLWGAESDDLNATLLAWPPGESTPEHVNDERDVLVVVVAGGGTIELDGEPHELRAPTAVLVSKGLRRRFVAGLDGIRYVTAHVRRGGLQISRR
jgi:quercetin dioxygenase-like cupin family protein